MKNLSPTKKIKLTATILFFITLFSHAQENHLPETSGSFYAISVEDLDRAIEWYTKNLHFKLESRAENDERRGVLLTRKDVILELAEFAGAIHRNEIKPNMESHEVHGIFKIGFITKNLDGTFKTLEESNVEIFFPIVTLPNGNRTFGIKDVEGNVIQFFGK